MGILIQTFSVSVCVCGYSAYYTDAVLTTSVKGSEAGFHSPPGKRVSFWKTSSMNSVCPASASVSRLKNKVRHKI